MMIGVTCCHCGRVSAAPAGTIPAAWQIARGAPGRDDRLFCGRCWRERVAHIRRTGEAPEPLPRVKRSSTSQRERAACCEACGAQAELGELITICKVCGIEQSGPRRARVLESLRRAVYDAAREGLCLADLLEVMSNAAREAARHNGEVTK